MFAFGKLPFRTGRIPHSPQQLAPSRLGRALGFIRARLSSRAKTKLVFFGFSRRISDRKARNLQARVKNVWNSLSREVHRRCSRSIKEGLSCERLSRPLFRERPRLAISPLSRLPSPCPLLLLTLVASRQYSPLQACRTPPVRGQD